MRVNVVTPWYPDYASRYSGIFVHQQVAALRNAGVAVTVEVPSIFPAPPGPIPPTVTAAMRELAAERADALYATEDSVTWIPAPVPSRSGSHGRVVAFTESVARKREFSPVDTDVHHAHLGVPTGAALVNLGDKPLVVTEHQSTLRRIFNEPEALEAYRKTVQTSDRFYCVSTFLRDQIELALGFEAADRIEIMPNIVDLTDIKFAAQGTHELDRWIYVGTVAAHKGIETLLQTFKAYVRRHSSGATLTIVGDGPHMPWVKKFVAANGFRSRIRLLGSLPHNQIGQQLADADTMVHLSPSETFGIASLEGIGAGLPVISLQNGGAESAWGDMEKECGLLLAQDLTTTEIADAIAELKDSSERLDPGAGRAMVESRFSPAAIVGRLMKTYNEVLD